MEGLIWVHENLHGIKWLDALAKIITFLGDFGLFWILLAVILFCFKKTRISAVVMAISLACGYMFNDVLLKNIIMRPRPFYENESFKDYLISMGLDLPIGYSFPSGHAFSSFNCAVILMLFNKKLGYVALPMATLIALSRPYICVHYPTDILVGSILGSLFAVCMFAVYKFVMKKLKNRYRNKIREDMNV